jgi:hypothetical protein
MEDIVSSQALRGNNEDVIVCQIIHCANIFRISSQRPQCFMLVAEYNVNCEV